ncbi:hypothetical protein O181_018666 [Austropuccinia psidii MF-1]|uniref:Uncharacterized protein n=1 Tax=Austropuccinia psidii MF-1 TaxID=1389203 RepID=A0A9Q3C5R2_9BASI|nr:hypothetical protein [Austropuccinia psidii MF-1]
MCVKYPRATVTHTTSRTSGPVIYPAPPPCTQYNTIIATGPSLCTVLQFLLDLIVTLIPLGIYCSTVIALTNVVTQQIHCGKRLKGRGKVYQTRSTICQDLVTKT